MKEYIVRKWFYVDYFVKAETPEDANRIIEDNEVDLKNLEYFGDLDKLPDVQEA
jgi:hypothetical protein